MRAWLTGVGAMTVAYGVAFVILFELVSRDMIRFPEGRPTFEVGALPAYAIGAAVAARSGGWRGLLALVTLASLWVVMVPFVGADRDFFVRQLWAYGGIALGLAIARLGHVRVDSVALVGAGVYSIATLPQGVLVTVLLGQGPCQSDTAGRCVAVADVFALLCAVVGGAIGGLVAGRRASALGVALVALTLALPSLAMLVRQGWMWQYDGLPMLLGMASGVIGAVALFFVALLARTLRRGADESRIATDQVRPVV